MSMQMMESMSKRLLSKQFLFFLLAGGTAATVNIGSRIVYSIWLDFSLSIIFAYFTGMIVAFFLFKLFVFKPSLLSVHRSAAFFIIVNFVAILQTWTISMWFAYHLLPSLGVTLFVREIAHIVGVIVPVFTSYIGHKYYSFR
jgi:putative flippase GtrA